MELRDIMTPVLARRLYPVARGAARIADTEGTTELGECLMGMARMFRSIGRYGRTECDVLPGSPTTVKASDLPAEVRAMGKEVARTRAWNPDGPTLIGVVSGKPVWAKRHGATVRYVTDGE